MAYLFDPRQNKVVKTENPVLFLVDIMIRMGVVEPDDEFWEKIKLMSDYVETGNGAKSGIEKIIKEQQLDPTKKPIKEEKQLAPVKKKVGRPKGSKNKKKKVGRPKNKKKRLS